LSTTSYHSDLLIDNFTASYNNQNYDRSSEISGIYQSWLFLTTML
jgi:hypothetical protein